MTAAQQRTAQRLAHLVAALVLVAYVYAPSGGQLQAAVRVIVVPVLALTGILMWQAPRIRRLRKTVSRTHTLDATASTTDRGSTRTGGQPLQPESRSLSVQPAVA